jgi:hypothetical protein
VAPGGVTFLFDANLPPRLSEALRLLGEQAHHVNDFLPPGTPDEIWIRYAGERSWNIVSRDVNITKRPHEQAALLQHGIGAFFLFPGMRRQPTFCQLIRTVISRWPEMKHRAAEETPPFALRVPQRGIIRPL